MATKKSGTRELLLEATITELALVGPSQVDLGQVSRRLGISPSLVNHFFGSRAKLLIEASILSYERYVDQQLLAIANAGESPEDQLHDWIEAQVAWTVLNLGIAIVIDFPRMHTPEGGELSPTDLQRLDAAAAKHLGGLASVIDRIQRGTSGQGWLSREAIAGRPDLMSATAHVGWLVYGHALWRAGRHAPTTDIPEVRRLEEAVFAGVPAVAVLIARGLTGHHRR